MISEKAVESALRSLIQDLDYDMHKELQGSNEDLEDYYPGIAADFLSYYSAEILREYDVNG